MMDLSSKFKSDKLLSSLLYNSKAIGSHLSLDIIIYISTSQRMQQQQQQG